MTKQVEAFKLTVPDIDIADLRERLRRTRFPDQAPGSAWAYGTDVAWMRGLIDYWRDTFDWRTQEARLNGFPHYKVHVHDIDLHFLQVEGEGPDPCPLLLSHGWPGSVFEFLELIPRLANPEPIWRCSSGLIHRRGTFIARPRLIFFARPAAFRGGGDSGLFRQPHARCFGVSAIRRPGRRLGFIYHITTCVFVSRAPRRNSPEHDAIAARSQDGRRSNFRRAEIHRAAHHMTEGGDRLPMDPGDATPDACIRTHRFAGRPRRMDH